MKDIKITDKQAALFDRLLKLKVKGINNEADIIEFLITGMYRNAIHKLFGDIDEKDIIKKASKLEKKN